MMDKLNLIIDELVNKLDDPEWLSKKVVELSALLITHSQLIAQAQLDEETIALKHLDAQSEKRVTVAEAEKRAIVETNNGYKQLSLEREAIIETINSIKKRIEILGWERRNG